MGKGFHMRQLETILLREFSLGAVKAQKLQEAQAKIEEEQVVLAVIDEPLLPVANMLVSTKLLRHSQVVLIDQCLGPMAKNSFQTIRLPIIDDEVKHTVSTILKKLD